MRRAGESGPRRDLGTAAGGSVIAFGLFCIFLMVRQWLSPQRSNILQSLDSPPTQMIRKMIGVKAGENGKVQARPPSPIPSRVTTDLRSDGQAMARRWPRRRPRVPRPAGPHVPSERWLRKSASSCGSRLSLAGLPFLHSVCQQASLNEPTYSGDTVRRPASGLVLVRDVRTE